MDDRTGSASAEYNDNPVSALAEDALRRLGATDRLSAERTLAMWRHTDELTDRERDALLLRFGPPPSTLDSVWNSGTCGGAR